MRESAAVGFLLILGLALVVLGFTGKGGVMLAAVLAPQGVQLVGE